jgi:purine-binding chemotaxis protein CheW
MPDAYTDDVDSVDASTQVLTFDIASQEYGLEILQVQEIKGDTTVTRMPNTPSYVLGVTNLRGAIIPIVDLRRKFGLASDIGERPPVVIVGLVGDKTVGLAVDAVTDVLDLARGTVQTPPEIVATSGRPLVRGIAHVDDRLITLLDLAAVVGPDLISPA